MSLPPELEESAPPPAGGFVRTEMLAASIAIRVPTFAPETPVREKVQALEDWILGSAAVAGALSAERLDAHERLATAQEAWEQLDAGFGKSQADARKAKALLRPDLDRAIRVERWRVDRLTEEIDRLEREYAKVSRAYTMMSGT